MKAVVFRGPHDVRVEERPVPEILEPTDVVVKVEYTALCGSDLHVYRGIEDGGTGFIMGHEFVGTVDKVGDQVKTLRKGDLIVSPFTTSCGDCFYCRNDYSSRCVQSQLYGSQSLDGAQAEYVRVPLADTTAIRAPEGIDKRGLLLMADIFPTGYFAAKSGFDSVKTADVVVVIGCGPVGLCAVLSALQYKPKHLLAVDNVQSRLDLARALGAEAWSFEAGGLKERVMELTDGRGADVVLELVGLSAALRLAFDLLRPWGFISSVGVHNAEVPWTGEEAYGKNLRIQMGRCPVRTVFADALEVFERVYDKMSFMFDHVMSLDQAPEAYDLFEKRLVQKVIFDTKS